MDVGVVFIMIKVITYSDYLLNVRYYMHIDKLYVYRYNQYSKMSHNLIFMIPHHNELNAILLSCITAEM